jgi:transposase
MKTDEQQRMQDGKPQAPDYEQGIEYLRDRVIALELQIKDKDRKIEDLKEILGQGRARLAGR